MPRLRSYNLSGGFADGLTTLPPGILDAFNGRTLGGQRAMRSRMLAGRTNPDGPRHPVKIKLFENDEGRRAYRSPGTHGVVRAYVS